MFLAVLSGFVLAFLAPIIHRHLHRASGWVLALLPAGIFAYLLNQMGRVLHDGAVREVVNWVPSLDVDLAFRLDGLALLMALIISGIGACIIVYAGGYLKGDPNLGRMYAFLLAFMAAMLGVVLSDNLMGLFVFWELTSITSYLLIGYKHGYADSRNAALRALVVTGGGGLAMMAGFVLLGLAGGSFDISQLNTESVQSSGAYTLILILVGLGAATKSAQFPFHFWLPGAMAAPTPVSAYLHSATMVKAGVFLLARLSPALAGTDTWRLLFTTLGVVTMLVGGYLSLKQTDLKRILAYSTVSSLGVLVALLGWDTKIAAEAAVIFLLVHSLYKGTLFMVAGAIDHGTGTRDIRRLGGLAKVMPTLALASGLAALSMSGMLFFLGFLGKEFIYEATLGYVPGEAFAPTLVELLLTVAALLTNIAFVGVALLVTLVPFRGEQKETPHHPHRPPLNLWLSSIVLATLGMVFGLLPQSVSELLRSASESIYGSEIELHLFVLPTYISPMLILSVLTIVGGIIVYRSRARIADRYNLLDFGERFGPERLYERVIDGLPDFAKNVTKLQQSGYLRYYVATIVGVLVLLVTYTYFVHTQTIFPADTLARIADIQFHEAIIALVIILGLVGVMRSTRLLVLVVSLGVVGYGTAVVFVLFGAPDLAMTQFSIETLTVILFVLVLYRLPEMARLSTRSARARDTIIAVTTGGIITLLILTITSQPLVSPLREFFASVSYTAAHGHNIVNVILVDFRGIDTMGEITVLGIAAIGIFALLKLRLDRVRKAELEKEREELAEAVTEQEVQEV